MFKHYLSLLNENLNFIKRQLKEDSYLRSHLKFAKNACEIRKYRVVGMLELMQEIGEISWRQENEERKKVDELFKLENLLNEIEKGEKDDMQ